MREYESIFVLDPTVNDSHVDMEVEKIREFLNTRECEITEVQKWGRRKLAYEVKKHKEGIYTLIRFAAEADVPHELTRRYRLNENMLRFLTVVYEKPPVEEEQPETATAPGAPGGTPPAPGGEPAPAAAPAAEAAGETKTETQPAPAAEPAPDAPPSE
jgi:small subunit ribosomal protein S6